MLILNRRTLGDRICLLLAAKVLISVASVSASASAERSGRRAEGRPSSKRHQIRLTSHSSEASDLNSSISVEAEALPVLTLNGTYNLRGGSKATKTSKKKSKRDKKKTKGEAFSPGEKTQKVMLLYYKSVTIVATLVIPIN